MRSIAFTLVALLTCNCVANATDDNQEHAGCASVYVMREPGLVSSPGIFWEVSASVDDSPFKVMGKLGSLDWGAFSACGPKVALRFRSLFASRRVAGPIIRSFDTVYTASVGGNDLYFKIRDGYLSEARGRELLSKIKAQLAEVHFTATGWDWIDRRELYYGKDAPCTREISERCP